MRIDFVFSYWIFFWYILYELKLTSFNPKLAVLAGLIQNSFILGMMIYFKNSWIHIFLFCLINTVLKVIPFWNLRNTKYHKKDAYAMMVYFMIYLIWMFANGKLGMKFDIYKKVKHNEPIGPFIYYIVRHFNHDRNV